MSGSLPIKKDSPTKTKPHDTLKNLKEPQNTISEKRCYKIREIDLLFLKIKLPPERVKCPNIDTIE